jgi:class 3 adenylate cyclase
MIATTREPQANRQPEYRTEEPARAKSRRPPRPLLRALWAGAFTLPVIGFVSLLERSRLDPQWTSPRLHFCLFLAVGGGASLLAFLAGQAADRRRDARVFLLSLAFLVTGGFLAVHALGTPGILLNDEKPGFEIAIPVGLFLASLFALGSAIVDMRPGWAATVVEHRGTLRRSVLVALGVWIGFSLLELPPFAGTSAEAPGGLIQTMAALGAAVYAIATVRYVLIYRHRMTALPLTVVGCFILLAEAMFGSALIGERTWHASWWEWHGLIVTAYVIVLFAANQEWSEERFRHLYLQTTRERKQMVSVLFADLQNFTTFVEQSSAAEMAEMLSEYYGVAAPLLSEGFGGDVEKFIGDAVVATFNSRGDQADHAIRAARAGLELQRQWSAMTRAHASWPHLRVGVNTGDALVRELGGRGRVEYAIVGDPINVGARLESEAPVGGVLIGSETYRRLPPQSTVEARPGLKVKGKRDLVDAYVVHSVPA